MPKRKTPVPRPKYDAKTAGKPTKQAARTSKQRRAGARKKEPTKLFEPTEQQRALVRGHVIAGTPRDAVHLHVINPKTGKPISTATLYKHFRRELDLALQDGLMKATAVVMDDIVSNRNADTALKFLAKRGGALWNPAINVDVDVTHRYDDLPRNRRLHLIAALLDAGGDGKADRLPEPEAAGDAGRTDQERDRVIDLDSAAWSTKKSA